MIAPNSRMRSGRTAITVLISITTRPMCRPLCWLPAVALFTIACLPDRAIVGSAAGDVAPAARDRTASLALDRLTKRRPLLNGQAPRDGTGQGVTIYVFDGGIAATHPELAGRVRAGFDAYPGAQRVCNSHGTAVAGAAAGRQLGVAPEAEIVDVKIFQCGSLRSTPGAIVAAARWTAADRALNPQRAAIANWSFIVDTMRSIPAIDTALAILREARVLVVASAGNFDIDACRVWPVDTRGVVVVGASTLVRGDSQTPWRDVREPETAWGRCVDMYAPGEFTLRTDIRTGRAADIWDGTSVAAGFASGAAALLYERRPLAEPAEIVRALRRLATDSLVDERVPTGCAGRGRMLYIGGPER